MPVGMDLGRLHAARALALKLDGATALQGFVNAGGVVSYISPALGYRARFHGFTATGTAGGAMAVQNWIAQVIRKTEGM